MTCVDAVVDMEHNLGHVINETWENNSMKGHAPTLWVYFNCADVASRPLCITYSMDEMEKS